MNNLSQNLTESILVKRDDSKMPTGIVGLDHILDGGLIRGNAALIEGPPGSGKSTLGVQILCNGATMFNEPAVMVAFEEFPKQIYSEYAAYGLNLAEIEEKGLLRVIWTDPRKVIAGLTGKDDLIGKIIDEMGARRVLIDSISHFRRVAPEEIDLREVLHRLINNLKLKGVNALLVKELERADVETIAFEEYVVDASIRVINRLDESFSGSYRGIEVRKTRGQKHIGGVHPFEFGEDGINVYPRLSTADIDAAIPQKKVVPQRLETGTRGLDDLMGGGFNAGTLNVLVGYSGTGKTTLCRHFLRARLAKQEKVLVISHQESADRFIAAAASIGMNFEDAYQQGQIDFWYVSPVGMFSERFLYELVERIGTNNYSALIWDSISDLRTSITDETVLSATHILVAQLLRRAGLTALLVNESAEMCGLIRVTEQDFAKMADSVIQLSFAEIDGRVHRFLGIMKMVSTDHAKDLREFEITSHGMHIKSKATGLSGILSGRAEGRFEAVAEQVLEPLSETTLAVAKVLESQGLKPDDRQLLVSARQNLGIADIVLREHFGMSDLAAVLEDFDIE